MVESKAHYISANGTKKRKMIPTEISNRLKSMNDFRRYFEDCRKFIIKSNLSLFSLDVCSTSLHVQQRLSSVTAR